MKDLASLYDVLWRVLHAEPSKIWKIRKALASALYPRHGMLVLVDDTWPPTPDGRKGGALRVTAHVDSKAVTLTATLHVEDDGSASRVWLLDDPKDAAAREIAATTGVVRESAPDGSPSDNGATSKDLQGALEAADRAIDTDLPILSAAAARRQNSVPSLVLSAADVANLKTLEGLVDAAEMRLVHKMLKVGLFRLADLPFLIEEVRRTSSAPQKRPSVGPGSYAGARRSAIRGGKTQP